MCCSLKLPHSLGYSVPLSSFSFFLHFGLGTSFSSSFKLTDSFSSRAKSSQFATVASHSGLVWGEAVL